MFEDAMSWSFSQGEKWKILKKIFLTSQLIANHSLTGACKINAILVQDRHGAKRERI
jgi:hypothetical protein